MPTVRPAEVFAHLRRACRSRVTHVVIGDGNYRPAVAGLAAGLVEVAGVSPSYVRTGRFTCPADSQADPIDADFCTFSMSKVAFDTIPEVLGKHGVRYQPTCRIDQADVVVLSDRRERLLNALSSVAVIPDGKLSSLATIAPPRASCATPALAV